MSAPVAPQNEEEMERALDAPPVCANLVAGGAMFVVGETGFLCSPMGMVSITKCIQKCCCPERMQLAFAYTSGDYAEGVQVDQVTPACCGKMHFTMSDKDYTQPAGEEAGFIQKKLIEQARSQGMADDKIAKMFPKKILLGKSKTKGGGPKKKGGAGVTLPDGENHFYLKGGNKMCGDPCAPTKMCKMGILKGKMCMNFKLPVYNQEEQIVAYVVQTVPLIPSGCCCARPGPTVQMAIHKTSHEQEMSPEDAKRLGLFLFTVKPNVGPAPGGGPMYFINKIIDPTSPLGMKIWNHVGWTLGVKNKGVERRINQIVAAPARRRGVAAAFSPRRDFGHPTHRLMRAQAWRWSSSPSGSSSTATRSPSATSSTASAARSAPSRSSPAAFRSACTARPPLPSRRTRPPTSPSRLLGRAHSKINK